MEKLYKRGDYSGANDCDITPKQEMVDHFRNVSKLLDNVEELTRKPTIDDAIGELSMANRWLFEDYYSNSLDGKKDTTDSVVVIEAGQKILTYIESFEPRIDNLVANTKDCETMLAFLAMQESYTKLPYHDPDYIVDPAVEEEKYLTSQQILLQKYEIQRRMAQTKFKE